MGQLSTEAIIFSFGGGLSTGLSGSYSQSLIHRKTATCAAEAVHGQAAIGGNRFK
jgi:hypothetical protein